MGILILLFGVSGRTRREPFAIALAGVLIAFWLGVRLSEAALPWMARILAPRGINAGLALNMIWLALGVLATWSSTALIAKRLRDRGRPGWWAVALAPPLAILALLNDAIFLVSRSFVMPSAITTIGLVCIAAIGGWLLWECAQPSRPS